MRNLWNFWGRSLVAGLFVLSASIGLVACGDEEVTRLELIEELNDSALSYCMKVAACGMITLAECEATTSDVTGRLVSGFNDTPEARECLRATVGVLDCVEKQSCTGIEDYFEGGLVCAGEDLKSEVACQSN